MANDAAHSPDREPATPMMTPRKLLLTPKQPRASPKTPISTIPKASDTTPQTPPSSSPALSNTPSSPKSPVKLKSHSLGQLSRRKLKSFISQSPIAKNRDTEPFGTMLFENTTPTTPKPKANASVNTSIASAPTPTETPSFQSNATPHSDRSATNQDIHKPSPIERIRKSSRLLQPRSPKDNGDLQPAKLSEVLEQVQKDQSAPTAASHVQALLEAANKLSSESKPNIATCLQIWARAFHEIASCEGEGVAFEEQVKFEEALHQHEAICANTVELLIAKLALLKMKQIVAHMN